MTAVTTPFLGAEGPLVPEGWGMLGAGLDRSASFRSGCAAGPEAMRLASDCLETYCPVTDRCLGEIALADLGDVDLGRSDGSAREALDRIRDHVGEVCDAGGRPFLLGGEHSVTAAAVEAVAARHDGLFLLHLDAHADLREDYEGDPDSHACAARRSLDILGPDSLAQIGVRSGTREEWQWIRSHGTLLAATPHGIDLALERAGGRPIYVSLDLDVLDPSVLCGTGSPEPGGLSYEDVDLLLRRIAAGGARVVGVDVVELAPALDPSGASAIVAAKIIRTALLTL